MSSGARHQTLWPGVCTDPLTQRAPDPAEEAGSLCDQLTSVLSKRVLPGLRDGTGGGAEAEGKLAERLLRLKKLLVQEVLPALPGGDAEQVEEEKEKASLARAALVAKAVAVLRPPLPLPPLVEQSMETGREGSTKHRAWSGGLLHRALQLQEQETSEPSAKPSQGDFAKDIRKRMQYRKSQSTNLNSRAPSWRSKVGRVLQTASLGVEGEEQEEEEDSAYCLVNSARRVVQTGAFEGSMILLILGYSVLLAFQAELDAEFFLADVCFLMLFAVEIALRFLASTARYFKDGWNVFDAMVVGSGLVELALFVMNTADPEGGFILGTARLFKILRFVRVLRVVRVARTFRELRLIIRGLSFAARTLSSVLMILLVVMFVFAIFFTEVLKDERQRQVWGDWDVDYFFGSLSRSMFTLFQLITLDGWSLIARPLLEFAPWAVLMMVGFISLTTFAILNVVTGVFVEQTQAGAQDDDHYVVKTQTAELVDQAAALQAIFLNADADGGGTVSWLEFESIIETPEMKAQLARMGLTGLEALRLFDTLDHDGNGTIDYDEFLYGCMRIRGQARSLDIVSMQHDVNKLNQLAGKMEGRLREMSEALLPVLLESGWESQTMSGLVDYKEGGYESDDGCPEIRPRVTRIG